MKLVVIRDHNFYPDPRMETELWDLLCRAYGVEYEIVRFWTEATVPEDSRVICFDEAGSVLLTDHEIDHNAAYVFGRNCHDILNEVGSDCYESVRIPVNNPVSMMAISAGSILLGSVQQWPSQ
jgi:tRNA(Leu) C34 or U34 (ribose-2'-O)-methylase TrmL